METSTVTRSIIFTVCCLLIAPASFARQSTKAGLYGERYAAAPTPAPPIAVADKMIAKRCWPSCPELMSLAGRSAGVSVLVTFDVPYLPTESHTSVESLAQRRDIQEKRKAAIARAREHVIANLPGRHSVGRALDLSPRVAMVVDQTALRALLANPAVVHVGQELELRPSLRQTIPLIAADPAGQVAPYRGYLWYLC